ncbi:hypothetical protein PAAG_04864 [Paracoccidioides lutzii Pb01]|uniref:Uncharacterized protein n=1 Tax=Paracoccidioides lutzii (strain ATCC MYA-826 / Pb01) TaxID=502779 RepID=C1H1S8_PARBA|nr:hypothetical protein PAAG_04864 [Paracoccidioides lutzii Pb01]EEH33815.2 hypothetical protein PAAG_04864 [Paracoccidioides lutzii Pb01]
MPFGSPSVSSYQNSLRERWKHEMLDVPVFRRTIHTVTLYREHAFLQTVHCRMTRSISTFQRPFTGRHLRALLHLAEGETGMLSPHILGVRLRESVIRAAGMMSLTRDPGIPKALTDEQKSAVNQHPHLVELDRQEQDLSLSSSVDEEHELTAVGCRSSVTGLHSVACKGFLTGRSLHLTLS